MIHPVVLCGGSGTRLWPLSRKDYPKQFSNILGEESLFQACLKRFQSADFASPLILTHSDFRFLVAEQLSAVGEERPVILLEPEARNTAPAILTSALYLEAKGKADDLMLVAPSDHVIRNAPAFQQAVEAAVPAARDGQLVTFGICPDQPETGYGYLELARVPDMAEPCPVAVLKFIEKPNAERAGEMVANGDHLWNAGIFLFQVGDLIKAFQEHAPHMLTPCRAAVETAEPDLGFLRISAEAYSQVPEDSIDYALMEKATNVSTIPVECGWSDLGAWEAVWREMKPDDLGVALVGTVTELGCANTLLRSEEDGPRVVGIGLDGLVVVAMHDAVLVADMEHLQDVKTAVAKLKAEEVPEAETFPRCYRPWGWYEGLGKGARFQVKEIMVPPGRRLSLQSHVHRAEHWIVVAGSALVTIDEEKNW